MGVIKVQDQNGKMHELETVEGWRVMEIIREHGLPIKAECGGACACATCHVYVDPAWIDKVGRAVEGEMEAELLQFAEDFRDNSRLACQIDITDALDGLVLDIPSGQH